MKTKLESLSGDMFKSFDKSEIGNLGQIVGGKRVTKSSTTGWYSCDKGDDDAWFATKKEARADC